MKKRRLLSIVLAFTMIFTMFGNLTAFGAATWYSKYTFSITAVDGDGNNVEGVKYKISYTGINDAGTQETDETAADGTTVEFVTDETTCTLTYTTIPEGYICPSKTEMTIILDDSTEQFTNNNMTVTEINTTTHTYNLGLTLQTQSSEDDTSAHENHPVCGASCGVSCVEGGYASSYRVDTSFECND